MPVTTIALDTFVEASNTNLNAHSADSGFGSYEYSGVASQFVVQGATNNCIKQFVALQFARSTSDVTNDNFETFVDLTRDLADGTDEAGVYFLGDDQPVAASIVGGGIIVYLRRLNSTSMDVRFTQRNDAGVIQPQDATLSSISLALGGSIRLGAQMSDGTIAVFTETAFTGGSRASISTEFTPFLDQRDANHQRAGLFGANDFSYDSLAVTTITPSPPDAAQSSLSADPTTLLKQQASTVTATILDGTGSAVSDSVVTFSTTGSAASVTQPAAGSNASGLVAGIVTAGDQLGAITVSAQADGVNITETEALTVIEAFVRTDSLDDTHAWAQLTPVNEVGAFIDFRLLTSEQFPMFTSEDRPLITDESPFTEP